MASGLPVIAPDVGGVGEAVSDETGYLIPDAGDVEAYVNALAALTTDPADALLRAQRAREQIERDYSFDGLCATLESIDSYLPRAVSPAR
jgi:glycosyltransferase involved in cell wall biosynthesis